MSLRLLWQERCYGTRTQFAGVGIEGYGSGDTAGLVSAEEDCASPGVALAHHLAGCERIDSDGACLLTIRLRDRLGMDIQTLKS
jgi:hypothetical protein